MQHNLSEGFNNPDLSDLVLKLRTPDQTQKKKKGKNVYSTINASKLLLYCSSSYFRLMINGKDKESKGNLFVTLVAPSKPK